RSLMRCVADSLLAELRGRDDLAPETANAIAHEVDSRLGGDAGSGSAPAAAGADSAARARALHDSGALDAAAVEHALATGDRPFVVAALALLAGTPEALVRKIVSLESAKGIVALAWKAGLTPALAHQLQLRVARIAPSR